MNHQRNTVIAGIAFTLGAPAGAAHAQTGGACGDWENLPSPNPGSTHNGLMEVAIRGADDVLVLGGGSGGSGSLFLTHWDGTEFSPIAWPDLEANAYFEAMAPVSDRVWLAGFQVVGPFFSDPLMIRWDGADWDRVDPLHLAHQTVYPFNPRKGAPRDLDGVADDDIWVIGDADAFGDAAAETIPLTLHWDGSEWTEVITYPATNYRNELFAVDMMSADDGWAVGHARNLGGYYFGLIYHWDGVAWTHFSNPIAGIQLSHLNDVAALAPDDVWVVGDHNGVPLFGHYDGSGWTVTEIEASVATTVVEIAAIAFDDIWAVGSPEPGYYHYDGTNWEVMGAPEIPGAVSVSRTGDLEVVGPCDLWSVGGWYDGTVQQTLVERLRPSGGVEGDATGDGVVDLADIVALLAAWGPCGGCPEDLDDDGFVTFSDILIILANWS